MNDTILEMKGISKYIFDSYGVALRGTTVKILDRVDFDLKKGEVHILVGENGAGKSTLMKVLGGIIPPDEGRMVLDGKPVSPKNPREAQGMGIGFIHQELNLCDNLTVADNIFMGREMKAGILKDTGAMRERARCLLKDMGIDIDPDALVRNLSTAQQQLVEIVKVLSKNCRIIIMDEPTSSLTRNEIDILFTLIKKLRESGVAIIYISHRLEEFDEIGDRLSVLRDGKSIGTLEREAFETDRIVQMMVGRALGDMYTNRHKPGSDVVLEVKNLRLEPGTKPISVSVRAGEIVGLGGLVGAGRTELAKSIIGYRRFHGGEIRYLGKRVLRPSPTSLVRKGLVYLTEDRKGEGLILDMSIAENLTLMSLYRLFRRFFMFGSSERKLACSMGEQLDIVCSSVGQLTRTLSGGNQQKVVLGKCLIAKPKLLILDEPTRGIDVGAKMQIYRMMDEIAGSGVAVLMISSDMPELIGMSDRIYVMRDGGIAAEIDRKEDMNQEHILKFTIGKNAG